MCCTCITVAKGSEYLIIVSAVLVSLGHHTCRNLVAKDSEYLIIVSAVLVSLGHHTCRNLVAKGSEYLIIVSAALVSLLEHVTGTSFMSNVIFLINLPVCTLIAMGGGGCI